MISARTGVHLPDTTYGGTPIDWNCANNSNSELQQLRADNAKLRELVRNLYKRFHGVVLENWSYSTDDFDMLACRMRELGVEAE